MDINESIELNKTLDLLNQHLKIILDSNYSIDTEYIKYIKKLAKKVLEILIIKHNTELQVDVVETKKNEISKKILNNIDTIKSYVSESSMLFIVLYYFENLPLNKISKILGKDIKSLANLQIHIIQSIDTWVEFDKGV